MQTFLSVWFLFPLTHIVSADPGNKLKHGYSQIVYGHRLNGKTISSFAPISFLDCVEECLVRNRCLSVSYFKGANYCEIKYKDKLTAASSYQVQARWVYSEKGHWPQSLVGKCSNSTCLMNDKCQYTKYSDKGNSYHCVVSDCGLPDIYGIDGDYSEEGDAIGINRAMHVKCSTEHVQLGSGQLVCLSDGSWVYDITCEDNGCVMGWKEFRNHYYLLNTTQLNQTDAMKSCRLCGAYLVEIDDAVENDWITETLLKYVISPANKCFTWTGANDTQTEGVFVWEHSGTKVNYTNWNEINPDDYIDDGLIKDCIDLYENGQWNDRPCDTLNGFICEKTIYDILNS